MASGSGCDAGFFTRLFQGNAIVCSDTFQEYQAASDTKQIIDAAKYAQSNYPSDSIVQQIQQDAIDSASDFAHSTVKNVDQQLANDVSCTGLDFSFLGGPCITKTWLYVAGGIAAAIFFFVYVAPVLTIFKRR